MSPSVDSAFSQWMVKLAEMQAAIAELKRTQEPSGTASFVGNVDKDLASFNIRPYKGDVLDLVAKEYDEYDELEEETSSEDFDEAQKGVSTNNFDVVWLRQQCQAVEKQGSGLEDGQLYDQMSAILVSDSSGMNPNTIYDLKLFIEVILMFLGRRRVANASC